jgi:hypothetical protein
LNPTSTTFVLGYHGCDSSVAESVFAGKGILSASDNDYDWLGHGIYFWEYNAQRGYEFACEIRDRPRHRGQRVKRPAVVGAMIDLSSCLNLLDSRSIGMVRQAYDDLVILHDEANEPLPRNSGGPERFLRRLDCAVIEFLHTARQEQGALPFDAARAAFIEGGPIYKGAGFYAKNHIQICVRNPECIKGYFRPLDEKGRPLLFSGDVPPRAGSRG